MKKFIALGFVLALLACGSDGAGYLPIKVTQTSTITLPSVGNIPSRTSCVAPCGVFFDGSATTSSVSTANTTTKAFRNIEYTWNFGDPAGGATWSTGADTTLSKNVDYGQVAGHVYETPGTYNATMTANDGTSTATTPSITITVTDPNSVFSGTNTICVANGAAPVAGVNGCPTGAEVHGSVTSFSNQSNGVRSFMASNKRVLMKRGDTFNCTASDYATGNQGFNNITGWTLGAYGSGNRPILLMSGEINGCIRQGNSSGVQLQDVRIMDIDFNLNGTTTVAAISYEGAPNSSASLYYYNDFLISRINVSNGYRGIMTMQQTGVFQYENTISTAGYSSFSGGMINSAVLGGSYTQTSTNDVLQQGNMRWGNANKFRMSYANVIGGEDQRQHIKLHSQNSVPSTIVIFSSNKFSGGADQLVFRFGPQNAASGLESINNFIVERNWFVATNTWFDAGEFSATNGTIRNNFIDFSAGSTGDTAVGIDIYREGSEPVPDDIDVYNNTFYTTAANNTQCYGVRVDFQGVGATNITVRNNIGYAAPCAQEAILSDPFGRTVNSNNTLLTNRGATWVSSNGVGTGTFSNPPDFKLRSTDTVGLGTGFLVPIWSDFFNVVSPTPRDMGILNH